MSDKSCECSACIAANDPCCNEAEENGVCEDCHAGWCEVDRETAAGLEAAARHEQRVGR